MAVLTCRSPETKLLRFLAQECRSMVDEKDTQALDLWMEAARHSVLGRFAQGIHVNVQAIHAAIAMWLSYGPVEGR